MSMSEKEGAGRKIKVINIMKRLFRERKGNKKDLKGI